MLQVGPWVFAAGQIASDYKTGVAPEARRNLEAVKLGDHREFSAPYQPVSNSLWSVAANAYDESMRSILLAMMKSFSCSPLIFLVLNETVA
jgi:hypothetical protein